MNFVELPDEVLNEPLVEGNETNIPILFTSGLVWILLDNLSLQKHVLVFA